MNCIVVGADRLGNIPELLETLGIRIVHHVSGRASAHQRRIARLPSNAQLLILFTDFLNHNVMRSYRAQAQAQGLRILACRRSASRLIDEVRRVFSDRISN